MRIDPSEFVSQAVNLPVGHSMRIDHSCIGISGGTLMVTRKTDGITAYCFRCGDTGWQSEQENLEDRLNRMAAERSADAEAVAAIQLPEPRVYTLGDWPRNAALWLYKSGFSPSMIDKLGAYWCPKLGRVVLPVMEDGRAVFWQARSVTRLPKILSPHMPRRGIVAKYGRGDTLVLCEDTLSAYKVGQVTEAWSLLGTKLLPRAKADIIGSGRKVVVWLDSDAAGQAGAAKILAALRGYGVQCRNVITQLDPKLYDRDTITRVLNEP